MDNGLLRAHVVWGLAASLLFLAVSAKPAQSAEAWPNRPIRFIVPFGAGGSYDIVARLVGSRLSETLGQSVLVDNRPGAAGRLGMAAAVKAPPDGYTLLMLGDSQTIVPSVHKNVPYDLARDLDYVSMVATLMNTFVANPALPVKTIAELVAYSKARPGEVRYASSGAGGITHLAPALLQILTGADLSHVPYKSGAIAMNAIISGEVQMGMLNLVNALPQIQAGRLRVLAVTGGSRSSVLPDVPTAAESGAKGFDLRQFYAVAVPASTPRSIIQQLNREIVKFVASTEARTQLAQQAAEPMSSTPEATRTFVLGEQAKYAAIVKQIGLSQD